MTISAIIISKNEEENISDCIKTLEFADEVVVIDNKSTDATVQIAKKLKAKVYAVSGLDFSYLRNVGKEKASTEWIFYIDADERVTESLAKEIKDSVTQSKEYCAYFIKRKNYYFNKPWPGVEKITRLMRKDALVGWYGSLHETPIITGTVGELDAPLLHYTHNDISLMLKKTNEWSQIESQLRYKNNHPRMVWWRFIRVMVTSFSSSYLKCGGWRMGSTGLIEAIYQSFSSFITYAKLWEKQNI